MEVLNMSNLKKVSRSEVKLGIFIIANAIVWGAVILAVSSALKGTGLMSKVSPYMAGGSFFSSILLPTIMIGKKK